MEWRAFLLVVHLLSTLLMAAPFYMLIIVNERARFGVPLGYFTDRYMENIIRNNAVRCFVFQGTMLASGLGLIYVTGRPWISLLTEPTMVIKWVALAIMASLLSYIHFSVQPRIEQLMEQVKPDTPVPQGLGPQIAVLRSRRKKLSGICLFLVLTALIMGLQATFFYNFYLALGFVVVAALYAWRVYKKPVPVGWF
ncbi:MAG: hypothetical protein ABIK32_01405 [Chloroflexota bacterium]|nr:hypothetical protein [Chloroflexota bacterium]